MNEFNQKEFEKLREMFKDPYLRDIAIRYDNPGYFSKLKTALDTDRRGEVTFGVIRPCGTLITVTAKDYPKGVFRVPTGGLGYDEDVIEAVKRETFEELGLETDIQKFCGVIRIRLEYLQESIMFYSYIFILREKGGRLLADATDDEVSEVREVDPDELAKIAEDLGKIEGEWHDWGIFRQVSTSAALEGYRSLHKT